MGRLRAAAGALLLAGGVSAVAVAGALQSSPSMARADGGAAPAGTRSLPAGPASSPEVSAPSLPPSAPLTLEIPGIGVKATVSSVGLNPDGTVEVPRPGLLYDTPAWYRHSPNPGEQGPSVIVGHRDAPDGTPSVFIDLDTLRPGDEVKVTRADGRTVLFRVTGIGHYPKAQFPTDVVYGNTDHAALRLITCSGAIDAATGHYLDNAVVYASMA